MLAIVPLLTIKVTVCSLLLGREVAVLGQTWDLCGISPGVLSVPLLFSEVSVQVGVRVIPRGAACAKALWWEGGISGRGRRLLQVLWGWRVQEPWSGGQGLCPLYSL